MFTQYIYKLDAWSLFNGHMFIKPQKILLFLYSTILYITIILLMQIDLIGMPPVVSNRVLKRQPLNIYYLRRHLVELRQNSHCASGSLPAGPQHQTREPMAESSPLDVANSGRHFEQPLPVSSFTTSNVEHFTTAELIHVEVERHSISSCSSQSENSVTCEDLEASKQDVQYNLQLVSDEEEEREGEEDEERAVGGSDPEMASPI